MPDSPTPKAEATANRILETALALFREKGFDQATMREIAQSAGLATGAAYYYYPSKDAIILDFYRRSAEELQAKARPDVAALKTLEQRLRAIIQVKLDYFTPNRTVLRALLRTGADPQHPLSPFSEETLSIRESDIAWFSDILIDCGFKIPKDLAPQLPRVLWFFQMGIIFFWVTDNSPAQERTGRLLNLAVSAVSKLIRLSSLPLMKPLRKSALQIVDLVAGSEQ